MNNQQQTQTALVLGLGASGRAAAALLAGRGWRVVAADSADNAGLRATAESLRETGIQVQLAPEKLPLNGVELCVVSPGVPLDSDWCRQVVRSGIPLVGELELAARFCAVPVLAVTGSKGKSTAVKLSGDILRLAGKRVALGGNYGTPLSQLVMQAAADVYVVECSSFQLESATTFAPAAGVLLNIQPDHLDRHGTLECYAGIKRRMFAVQGSADLAVVPEGMQHLIPGEGRCVTFGTESAAAAAYRQGRIALHTGECIDISGTYFDNPVLGPAVAAVTLAVAHFGADKTAVETAVRSFAPLPHRMQLVAFKNGIRFINDSKATSLSATAAALQMCVGPVHLIAGGRLKEQNLYFLKEILEKCCKGVYCIGEAAKIMQKNWGGACECHECMTLERAFEKAVHAASFGDVVLLSPGCASFDQFDGFEQRGNLFIKLAGAYS